VCGGNCKSIKGNNKLCYPSYYFILTSKFVLPFS
jgi:hypothetical protein